MEGRVRPLEKGEKRQGAENRRDHSCDPTRPRWKQRKAEREHRERKGRDRPEVPVPDHGLDVPLIRSVQILPAIGGRVGDELDPGRASATRLEVDGEEGEEEASDRPGEECEREEPGPATKPGP
jgi:hypothetical protein